MPRILEGPAPEERELCAKRRGRDRRLSFAAGVTAVGIGATIIAVTSIAVGLATGSAGVVMGAAVIGAAVATSSRKIIAAADCAIVGIAGEFAAKPVAHLAGVFAGLGTIGAACAIAYTLQSASVEISAEPERATHAAAPKETGTPLVRAFEHATGSLGKLAVRATTTSKVRAPRETYRAPAIS